MFSFARTPKKTTKDASPSCEIPMIFLFELETNPTEMIMVDDLSVNRNLMFSLKL